MWHWGRSFYSPLSVTSGAGGVCTQVAAGGWKLKGVSGLASEHILLLRPAYLRSLDSLRRRCEEEVKLLGPGRWGRANGLKKTDQARAEDTAVALAAAIPMAQVSTIALILFYRLACTCMFDGGGEDEGGKRRCEYCSSSSRTVSPQQTCCWFWTENCRGCTQMGCMNASKRQDLGKTMFPGWDVMAILILCSFSRKLAMSLQRT